MEKKLRFNSATIHGGQVPRPSLWRSHASQSIKRQPMRNQPLAGTKGLSTVEPTIQHARHSKNRLASIENGKHGLAFASGLAAMDAIMKLLQPGDEVISTNDLYGGSYRLFTKIFEGFWTKVPLCRNERGQLR